MGLFDRFKNQEARGQEFYCIGVLATPAENTPKQSIMSASV